MNIVPVQYLKTLQYMPSTEHKMLRYGVAAIVAFYAFVLTAVAV